VTKTDAAADLRNVANCAYEMELDEYLKIGDIVTVGVENLTVVKVDIEMIRSVLSFVYRLENPLYIKPKPYENSALKGVSIEGKVIDVGLNHVKIHLDINKKQDVAKARWYPFAAEANNVCYVMPHVGERINLHITDGGENAIAMTATRPKPTSCPTVINFNPRVLRRTRHAKSSIVLCEISISTRVIPNATRRYRSL
jgi:hypothetical protein